MPPVVLQQLAETGGQAWVAGSQLREVIAGGEPLHITAEIRQFFQGAERCRLLNHYGPSETHVVTEQVLAGGSEQWETHPAIGRPIAGSRVYVLDDRLHLVPRGVPGEIYLSGQSVARCYLNHPRLTAEKFLPDLFAAKAGARMYKTGDLARFRPDGAIAFLSRVDHQVKLRGLRIELGEIDAVLVEHPKVSEAVTMMREDTPGYKRLVSYVVPARGAAPTVSMLHRFLRQWLPVYMLPADMVFLERIPVTTNGKVDRQALPAPARHRPDLDTYYVPPRTAVEQALAEMWQELLKVTQVGVEDNFFELGGNSLLATQLISRIEAKFGIDLPVRELFDSTTIADLATRVVSYEAAQLADEQRDAILAALEEMPEEEATALLEGQNGAGQ